MTPRVLVDAAAVPADRGALIRYVDGLVAALDRAGADVAVVCQRADVERYGALAPSARILPGPTGIVNRAARLVWEQTGVPLLARQVGAQVIHAPYYSMPLRSGLPTVVTVHDVTWFTESSQHSTVKASFFRSATRTAVRHASRVIVPSKATSPERLLAEGPEASLGASLTRDIYLRAATTAAAAGAAWSIGRVTGTRSRANTIGLVALVSAQLFQTLVAGGRDRVVALAVLASLAVLGASVSLPGLCGFFGCRPLGPVGWGIALGSACVTTLIGVAVEPLTRETSSNVHQTAT